MPDGPTERGTLERTAAADTLPLRACLRLPHRRGRDERLELWPDGPTVFGRTRHCDHRIDSRFLSRKHFAVLPSPEGYLLLDLESHNGTYRNDRRTRIALLREGDVVRAASRIMIFEHVGEGAAPRCTACGRALASTEPAERHRLCLGCRVRYPRVGETVADLRLDGALGDRAGLVDYVAGLEREGRTVRVRMLDGGVSRRTLRRLAGFSHPRAVAVHELVRHEGTDVLITDSPSPVTLALLTETGLPAPVGLVRRVMMDVAEALAAAHAEGVLHGELRPESVGIDGDGHALLDDLGLHELRAAASSDTDWFVAPERRGGRRRATRTDDVYAFGATYYQALTRKPPMPDYASGRIHETRPLASRRPDLPARIAFVIGRALAADPKERYPGFDEIVADLA